MSGRGGRSRRRLEHWASRADDIGWQPERALEAIPPTPEDAAADELRAAIQRDAKVVEEIHRQVLDPNADLGDLTATEFAGREEWTDGNADAGRRYAEARAAERAKRRQGAGALAERVVRGPADLDEWLGPEPQENAAQADARVRRDARLKRIDDAATGGFVTDPIV